MPSQKTYLALSVRAPLPVRAIFEALILDGPCSGIEEREDGFLACFPEGTSRGAILNIMTRGKERVAASGIMDTYEIGIEEIPHTDWSVQWKERFIPVETGEKIVIVAPWHIVEGTRIPIVIEPAMAFGTGDHATTQLCLEAVEHSARKIPGGSLLDIGTGTGILAIAGARLGFGHVTAIDNDPVAVEIAQQNSVMNRTPWIDVSDTPLNAVPGKYDVITANLTSETIKTLFRDILKRLTRGGTCIFSGILDSQKDAMLAFFSGQGILDVSVQERGGWCLFVMESP